MFNFAYWLATLSVVVFYAANFALFLLPGIVLATWARRRRQIDPGRRIVIVVCTGALLGYLAFWLHFFSKGIGIAFTIVVYATCFYLAWRFHKQSGELQPLFTQLKTPFTFMFLAGVGYLSLLYLVDVGTKYGPESANKRFFQDNPAGDNLIPLVFAKKLYEHQPLQPFCCGDWLSSDRPPLQTGIFLLLKPLSLGASTALQYQLVSTMLECLWIAGAWAVLRAIGVPGGRIKQILILLITSGFLFYNSVFVWPKLLAAALILFIVSLLIPALRSNIRLGVAPLSIASACLGLAMLAHPGSVFSLFAFGIAGLWRRRIITLRDLAVALLTLAILLGPWSAYQKIVDPPGNRLLKMHLAGVPEIDGRSFTKALHDSYSRHSLAKIARFKYENLANVIGPDPMNFMKPTSLRNTEHSRILQRDRIWNALGILHLGLLVAIYVLVRRVIRIDEVSAIAAWVIGASVVNLVLWCIAMFGPGSTVTTHSSYADILIISVGLAIWITAAPRAVFASVLLLQMINLVVVWIWPPAILIQTPGAIIRWPFVLLASTCFGSLLFISLSDVKGEST